jgi:hypothetical protein
VSFRLQRPNRPSRLGAYPKSALRSDGNGVPKTYLFWKVTGLLLHIQGRNNLACALTKTLPNGKSTHLGCENLFYPDASVNDTNSVILHLMERSDRLAVHGVLTLRFLHALPDDNVTC